MRQGRGPYLLLLPLVLWRLASPLPGVHPFLKVGPRVYHPGEEVLVLEGVSYPVDLELVGGLRSLGEKPSTFKGKGTVRVFMGPTGFGLKGPWGEGGCFVIKREVKWRGPFVPHPGEGGSYLFMVPWFTRFSLEGEVDKEWLCDVRASWGTRIERVKERGRGRFPIRVLEAREAWYRSLYITAWGVEDAGLRSILDHMTFLMGLMEHQILEGEEGMVRLNLLAWRDAMEELRGRLGFMASRGEPVGVWVRLLPSWRAWPRICREEKAVDAWEDCWKRGGALLGVEVQGPMAVFPFPLFSKGKKGGNNLPSPGVLSLLPLAQGCWEQWRKGVDTLAYIRSSALEADERIKGGLDGGGTWEIGWVPWPGGDRKRDHQEGMGWMVK